jgi:hypothetical protein
MSEERKTLLASLRDTIVFFKERKTVGRMKTEHSIFIPSTLMVDKAKETEDFIKAARNINQQPEWKCSVSAEQVSMGGISGVEFVFEFYPETDFDGIIGDIDLRLQKV